MTQSELLELLDSDFGCYYMYEEMPQEWTREALAEIPVRAAETVERLIRKTSAEDRERLIGELTAAIDEPRHPVVNAIIHGSRFAWTTDEDWPVLQQLLSLIAEGMRRANAS